MPQASLPQASTYDDAGGWPASSRAPARKDGKAVRGLKVSDFALTDRKKPLEIATFEEVSHKRPVLATGNAAAAGTGTLPIALKLDVASNLPVQADRLVMVFIDDLTVGGAERTQPKRWPETSSPGLAPRRRWP